jgi:hypothetical protein
MTLIVEKSSEIHHRVKFASYLRTVAHLTIAQSLAIARYYMQELEPSEENHPYGVEVRYTEACGEPGCCYGYVSYLKMPNGAARPLANLWVRCWAG